MNTTIPIRAALALLLAGTVPAAMAGPAARAPACESQPAGNDALHVSCPLDPAGAPQRLRFVARFSGGHDDTIAAMTPLLDGTPLACDDGSKTSLMGEDGDVSLHCRFSVPARAGARPVLQVMLKWSHAQYTDFELVGD